MNKTRIYAPSPGLVVYHVGESSRYGGSSGPIEKGATLRKGQDIIHLPDLSQMLDRKSTRLNSSHALISYAVFCLKKKTTPPPPLPPLLTHCFHPSF